MDFQQDLNRMVKLALKNYENAPMYKRSQENRLKAVGNIYFLFSDYELKYIGQRQLKGIKTVAIYGFCDIRKFTETTEAL